MTQKTEEAKSEEDLRRILEEDPGSECFVELAETLMTDEKTRVEAREICLRGLTRNPKHQLGRLLLARSYYLDGMIEFSVRELLELRQYCEAPSLTRLLESLGHSQAVSVERAVIEQSGEGAVEGVEHEEKVLAEFDLDQDFDSVAEDLESSDS